MSRPAPTGYSLTQIALHWLVFALVLFQLVFGESIGAAYRAFRKGETVTGLDQVMAQAHVIIGISIGVLIIWRLALRFTRGVPEYPADAKPAGKILAMVVHIALYVALLAAPVTGAMAWFGNIAEAGDIHEISKPIIIISLVIHVAGALVQKFVYKNNEVVQRMVKPQAS